MYARYSFRPGRIPSNYMHCYARFIPGNLLGSFIIREVSSSSPKPVCHGVYAGSSSNDVLSCMILAHHIVPMNRMDTPTNIITVSVPITPLAIAPTRPPPPPPTPPPASKLTIHKYCMRTQVSQVTNQRKSRYNLYHSHEAIQGLVFT